MRITSRAALVVAMLVVAMLVVFCLACSSGGLEGWW